MPYVKYFLQAQEYCILNSMTFCGKSLDLISVGLLMQLLYVKWQFFSQHCAAEYEALLPRKWHSLLPLFR